MICAELGIDNQLIANSNTVEQCSSYIILEKIDYEILVQPLTISSESIAYVFAWGFTAVLSFWFFGYVVGVIKSVLNKL